MEYHKLGTQKDKMCADSSERTKQMEPILRAKVKIQKWKLKKMLLIKNDVHTGFI